MSNQAYLSDEDYNFIYSRSPRICADLIIKRQDGKILLTKRDIEPYLHHWHLPGGRVKFRESVMEALNRISGGELGESLVASAAHKLIGIIEYPDEYQGGQPRHSISLVHLIEVDNDAKFKDGEWFDAIPDPIIPPVGVFLKSENIL